MPPTRGLTAEQVNALRALLCPPRDAAGAEALARHLQILIPEAVAASYLGPELTGTTSGPEDPQALARLPVLTASTPAGALRIVIRPEAAPSAQAGLDLAAALLTAGWRAEALTHAQTQQVLTLGEASGGLIHGLNNHLNGMIMQAAVLEMQAPEALRERAATIRRLGADAAREARAIQAVRPWQPGEGEQADLGGAWGRARLECGQDSLLETAAPSSALLVPASELGLTRLLTLVLRIGRRCAGPEAHLRAELRDALGQQFALFLPVPPSAAEDEASMPLPLPATPYDALERSAAAWLAREQGSRLEVHPIEGGLVLRLGWPPAGVA